MKSTYLAQIRRGVLVAIPQMAGRVAVEFSRSKPEEVLEVTVQSQTKKRTLSQNARMWAILQVFEAWGWHKDEAKTWCCGEFLPPIVREMPDGTRIETKASRTSTLNTKQMGEFMDRIEHWLVDQGVHLPADERFA